MWSQLEASFLLLYSTVSICKVYECVHVCLCVYVHLCLKTGMRVKDRKLYRSCIHVCVSLGICGSLYICLCVCMLACVFILQCSPPLSTPLHVFFSSVNSWLLEQNNCHFPASGSKVIQHNEMYKKEGEMADRRHAKSNVERSE